MGPRPFLTIVALMTGYCALATAENLAVHYYSEKSATLVGEPVFVMAEFSNSSSHTLRFDESPCLQSFTPFTPVGPARTETLYGCTASGMGGSCAGGFVELKPGEKLLRRYILPDGSELNSPGDFVYEVEREIRFYSPGGFDDPVGRQEVRETFTVHVSKGNEKRLRADYAPLVLDLQSPDPTRRSIALGAVTEHPQKFLEPEILELSQKPATMSASIVGLKKLRTAQTKQRLAELTDSHYDESVRQPATTALAELGDRNYCGLMLQVMNLRQGYTSASAARGAGLLCGETAIPQLLSLLYASPASIPPFEIAYALGNTASRSAEPALIELLRNSDEDVRRAAREALYTLAHRTSHGESIPEEYQDWSSWWALQGKTTRTFGPAECPEGTPL